VIPVNRPVIASEEMADVLDCLKSGWVSSEGPYVELFESLWSDYCGAAHGIAVSSGTAALEISVSVLRLQPDDEVIMPTFTTISCALAVLYSGGRPVLVDSDPATWQMDVAAVESKITNRTRAIMPVHIYGHPVDMDPLLDVARSHGLSVIEDAAEAHGAIYKGRKCGSLGDLSAFSFYANKLVTSGEGGMILTSDGELAEASRGARDLYLTKASRFVHERLGHSCRMSNLQAALGSAQSRRIEQIVARKREIARRYAERLADVQGLRLPVEAEWAESVYWVYGIVLEGHIRWTNTEFAVLLRQRGIETRPFFVGMHEQPVLKRLGLFENEFYPVAEYLSRRGLYLPSGVGTTDAEIEEVCGAIKAILSA
jgi:perosamine synthetase